MPASTLGPGLVPTRSGNIGGGGGALPRSTLGADLMPPGQSKPNLATPAAAGEAPSWWPSQGAQTSAPAARAQESRSAAAAARYFRELHGTQPSTTTAPHPPMGGGLGPKHCIYTGDDFVVDGDAEAMRAQASAVYHEFPHQPGPTICIYTGDDLAAPAPGIRPSRIRQEPVPPLPPTSHAVWLPAPRDADLQRLSEWKTRCFMPESLDGIPGFAPTVPTLAGGRDKKDALWQQERKSREQQSEASAQDKSRRLAAMNREVSANARTNDYGDPVAPRRKGEVFAPWAERLG